MGDRATCWSITINNPTEEDKRLIESPPVPGWELKGQYERGQEGTFHYQGMLTTPQVRFAAVKKVYRRAHIQVARNKHALENYVRKEETREALVESVSIPSIFEYQTIIAKKWRDEKFEEYRKQLPRKDYDDIAMLYLDSLVAEDIANGQRGAEWIASNPMWRNAWKKFWRVIIQRENAAREAPSDESSGTSPPCADSPSAGTTGVGGDEGDASVCGSAIE